ncbi:GPN-loop GTPase 2-like [Antedon mediterranea]|uniref:GPN-loop GTPase 2-like n=1 Tax=Antedon mediterranea TaxID=105859 RepID=UPI003AF583AA
MAFAQVLIGPPGAGKTTYCNGMKHFLTGIGRKVAIINLDPGNDLLPFTPDVDISELISVADVMDNLHLGPNGSLIYCMEYLEKNVDWLLKKLENLKDYYLLFDCPGQVELYTHHNSFKNILQKLLKLNFKLVAVHLVDSHYCSDPSKFISVLLTSLSTMLQLELPHINVLSKIDLVETYGKLAFNLDYYTEVSDLSYLLDHLEDVPFVKKFKKLNEAMIGLIQDYSLVSFCTLNIQNKDSMLNVMKLVDKANGYVFGDLEERNMQALMSCAVGADFEYFKAASVQEKYMKTEDEHGKMDDDAS